MSTLSYSRLFGATFATDEIAKAERDRKYQQLKKQGIKSKRYVLKNQLKKYHSLGVPCGDSCDVYCIQTFEGE